MKHSKINKNNFMKNCENSFVNAENESKLSQAEEEANHVCEQNLIQKIESNREKFLDVFKENKIGQVELSMSLNELIREIKKNEDNRTIENAVTIKGLPYDLAIKYSGGDLQLEVVGKNDQSFNTNRSDNQKVAGWIAQGDYAIGDNVNGFYTHKDHWGVSVAPELKGTGLSDFLYNLKSLVDNQLEFEHVAGYNYPFLTFYIKKGYVPCSIIKPPKFNEQQLKEDEIQIMLNNVIDKRKTGKVVDENDIDYGIKLTLDPSKAEQIYNKISNLEKF